jgi:hypothetical protein
MLQEGHSIVILSRRDSARSSRMVRTAYSFARQNEKVVQLWLARLEPVASMISGWRNCIPLQAVTVDLPNNGAQKAKRDVAHVTTMSETASNSSRWSR